MLAVAAAGLADDLGYNDVSFQGATEVRTPHIDRLAEEGVIFTDAYATHSLCSPARAGLSTGRHPVRFGLKENLEHRPSDRRYGLPAEEKTLAYYLRASGSRAGFVGQWHLGAALPFHPLHRGFEYFFGGSRSRFPTDALLRTASDFCCNSLRSLWMAT